MKKLQKIKPSVLIDRFWKSKLIQRFINWTKKTSFPGSKSIPIYDVFVFLLNEIQRFDLFTRANSIAFSFFLSLFPSLMVLFTLIPWFKEYFLSFLPDGDNFDKYLRVEIQKFMPGVAGDRLFNFIDDVTNNPRVGLLSFGFLLAIIFSSNGMISLMRGFEKAYLTGNTFKTRNFLKKRIIAIILTFQMGILLIGSITLIMIGEYLIELIVNWIKLDQLSGILMNIMRWVAILLMFYTGIGLIYRHGASTRVKFNLISPGATLATVLSIISSVGFSYYVNIFNTYNELYGSIGTIIVLMLWMQINALVLLIGFELNASIAVNRDLKEEIKDE